jgi:hypothetical protein
MRITTIIFATVATLVAGCASIADIDSSKKEPSCTHSCSTNYSSCIQGFTVFPIQAQHQCSTALHSCVAACPDNAGPPAVVPSATSTEQQLKDLKKLHDEGLISDEVYLQRQKAILDKQ